MFYSNKISKLNFVFDFTGGDSFTDIYGEQRFYSRTKLKKAIIDHDVPLILGSQTIGPFSCNNVTDYASKVIKDCLEVFTRDEMSYDYVKKITGRKAVLTTDVAFSLPYVKSTKVDTNGKTIGLNVSGLLWNGGYTKDNQFGLKVDYQEYSRKLVSYLLNKGYEVHLIPHAFKRDLTDVDNDLVAILKLHEEYPNTIVSPYFDSCIEAKSYIAKMDIFLGARMHSTIGAFSAGVPVIPFSYSRKFEGLFQSLEYPYVLNARELDTNACLKKTIEWIDNCSILALDMNEGHKIIQSRTANFTERLDSLFYAQ
jgi:polysaccharide pyruvyl transferase WcaK-like protein